MKDNWILIKIQPSIQDPREYQEKMKPLYCKFNSSWIMWVCFFKMETWNGTFESRQLDKWLLQYDSLNLEYYDCGDIYYFSK